MPTAPYCSLPKRVVQGCGALYHHGCRDAGMPPCMNMLWSRVLPIPLFRVKIKFSQAWIWDFLVMRITISVELSIGYRFMLRNKRHCLQVLEFEPGSCSSEQSSTIITAQLSQLLNRHTVPTEKQSILAASIWLNIFILHSSPVFNLLIQPECTIQNMTACSCLLQT